MENRRRVIEDEFGENFANAYDRALLLALADEWDAAEDWDHGRCRAGAAATWLRAKACLFVPSPGAIPHAGIGSGARSTTTSGAAPDCHQ